MATETVDQVLIELPLVFFDFRWNFPDFYIWFAVNAAGLPCDRVWQRSEGSWVWRRVGIVRFWILCHLLGENRASGNGTCKSVTCILRWASYKDNPLCPQCKHPFESLSVHRSLDGCIHDYLFEESVCLLLRAAWFIPLTIEPHEEVHDEIDDLYPYYYAEELEEDEEDLESYYMRGNSSTIRIGNRRWGNNGYVRAGRKEARPIRQNLYIDDDGDASLPRLCSSNSSSRKKDKEKMEGEGSSSKDFTDNSSSSDRKKNKEKKEGDGSMSKELIGRRAKRAMKREAADRLAAAKHQQRLQRFGLLNVITDRTAATEE